MLIVGITGSLGTGKTTVARFFKKRGAEVFDADVIAHQLISRRGACFNRIVHYFGRGILTNRNIDRKKLARLVFSNPEKLKKLCGMIHPVVTQEIKKKIVKLKLEKKNRIVIIDAPLLIEAGLDGLADILIVVKANREKQIRRIMKRMGIAPREALKRITAQMGIKEKIKRADVVIDNRGSLKETEQQVGKIWQRIMKMKTKN
jgi:dephospho-CoA kinase